MAYKLMETKDLSNAGRLCVFFTDTKSEFPATGALVKSGLGLKEDILPGSEVYSAKFEKAALKSDDNWEWGDEE